jgi:hypothetical protein
VLLRFLPNSTTRGRKGCLTSVASATRLRALETLTWRATLTCTIWRLNLSVPEIWRGRVGRSPDRLGSAGTGGASSSWSLLKEAWFDLDAEGGLEEGPKTVVLIDELMEVAVLGVGGSEFSLMMEQRGELAVVVEAGRGAASAVLGVFDSNGTEIGGVSLLGAVMERLGGWGRMETTRALTGCGTIEARLARLLLAMWMVSEGSRLRLGEVMLR